MKHKWHLDNTWWFWIKHHQITMNAIGTILGVFNCKDIQQITMKTLMSQAWKSSKHRFRGPFFKNCAIFWLLHAFNLPRMILTLVNQMTNMVFFSFSMPYILEGLEIFVSFIIIQTLHIVLKLQNFFSKWWTPCLFFPFSLTGVKI